VWGLNGRFASSGTLVLEIENKIYRVSEGDSFAFSSALPHRFYNDTSSKPDSS
jgi:mannose-6-phosphate isomerase-like protein (cupin superfamily)